ncbi:MAG: AI-2E family transporter [Pseudonocardiaceae bacterium]
MRTEPARGVEQIGAGLRGDRPSGRSVLPRGLAILLGSAAAVIILAGAQAAAWLIAPTFLALVIVIALHPIQRWMLWHGWPGWAASLTLLVAVYGLLVGFVLIMVVSWARLRAELPTYAGNAQHIRVGIADTLQSLGVDPEQAQAMTGSLNLGNLLSAVDAVLSHLSSALWGVVLLVALLLFLSLEASGVGARLAWIAADRSEVAAALGAFAAGTRTYLVVTTVFGLIVAVIDTVALALLGIPQAILWGVLAFITNYVPNIGFFLGLFPPALLALLVGGWPLLVWVVVIYCVANFVVQSLIQPRVVGDSVGLSTTVTFVSLVFWAWIVGPLGALLAVPLTLLAKAFLVDIDPRARWAQAWLRAQPSGDDPVGRRAGRLQREGQRLADSQVTQVTRGG